MRNLRTIILRIKSDEELKCLDGVKNLLGEKTYSKAIFETMCLFLSQKEEIRILEEEVGRLKTEYSLMEEKLRYAEQYINTNKAQIKDLSKFFKRKK